MKKLIFASASLLLIYNCKHTPSSGKLLEDIETIPKTSELVECSVEQSIRGIVVASLQLNCEERVGYIKDVEEKAAEITITVESRLENETIDTKQLVWIKPSSNLRALYEVFSRKDKKMLLKFLDQTEDLLELLKSNSVNPDRVELISAPSGFRLAKGTKLYKDENADEIAFILGEKIITLKRLTKTDNPKVFRFEKITFEFAEKSLEYFEKHGLSLDGNILRDRENREVGFNQGQATVRFVVSGDGETVSVFEADYEDSAGRIGRESCWMTIKNGRIRR